MNVALILFFFADPVLCRVKEAAASEYASHADIRVAPRNCSTRCESEGYTPFKRFLDCYSQQRRIIACYCADD